MRKHLFAVATALTVAAPASANDFPGLRVEATVGYDHTRGKVAYEDDVDPTLDFSADESTSGVTYGAAVGYDYKIADSFYLGAEASIDLADNKRCEAVFGSDAACFSVKRNFAAGLRLGTPLSKATLFYVGAAYVNGKARVSYTDDLDPTNNFSVSDTRDGYRLSVGIEQRLAGRFYGKVEYRHLDYKDYEVDLGTGTGSLGFDRHQVVGGVGVRF